MFILGPYIFEEFTDSDLQTCTVTSAWYQDMLIHCAIPESQQQNVLSEVVWMQDIAPSHVVSSIKNLLCQRFSGRDISRHFPFLWPPRSPDLTPMDFWL